MEERLQQEEEQIVRRRESFMREALIEAQKAEQLDEVPIGAVVVCEGEIVARAHNLRGVNNDPTAHAEVLALRQAGERLGRWNLSGCELYVTLEPCVMCSGAIVYARVQTVVFGAYDKRFGCCGTLMNLAADPRLNHRAEIVGGVLEAECLEPITRFFRTKRGKGRDGQPTAAEKETGKQ